ncbi:MAG: quinolinate synthase NadA [Lentisphaerae bacterium]|nr:quinolinate synthase NadA [Lentisphaerota bacterium]
MNTAETIEAIRRQWGRKLFIPGHYYQQDEVLAHADVAGDSLELSRRAAQAQEAERIVFCGVHFMAESAAIMSGAHQRVYMPVIHAGCPMADMAPLREVEQVWKDLQAAAESLPESERARQQGWLPVVYVNSSAAVKAFCGAHGGSTCTSSNAPKVIQWAFNQGKRVLFIPDEHLGVNTAYDMGLKDDEVAVYDPGKPWGGVGVAGIARACLLAWKGFCVVHTFTADEVIAARRKYPGAKIIVHPETPAPATRLADAHGSTSQIIRYVEAAPDGATIIIGTEWHLVDRLARQHRARLTIVPLRQSVCRNMKLTTAANLLALLQKWPEENIVSVPEPLRADARKALARMLELK